MERGEGNEEIVNVRYGGAGWAWGVGKSKVRWEMDVDMD